MGKDSKKKKTEKMTMSWRRYEKQKAQEHRARHIGGPGKEDYCRGRVKGEVKHRRTPMTKPQLKRIIRKGTREICSLSGYTKPAIEYVQKYCPKVKLFSRRRCIV
jgi:hypothetical protein